MRTERHRQRDLFESDRPLPKIASDLPAKIVTLVQALLIEATIGRASAAVPNRSRIPLAAHRGEPGARRRCGWDSSLSWAGVAFLRVSRGFRMAAMSHLPR